MRRKYEEIWQGFGESGRSLLLANCIYISIHGHSEARLAALSELLSLRAEFGIEQA